MTPEPNANHPDQPRAMLDAKKKKKLTKEKKKGNPINPKQTKDQYSNDLVEPSGI